MRRLVNNWLYGQISPKMAGRLDTDVYSAGCERLENMYVHRQGGISRRPPLKRIRYSTEMEHPFTRMIPFTISNGQSFILYLSPQRQVGNTTTSDIYIDNGVSVIAFSEFEIETFATKYRSTWGALSEDELRNVRYANYYNALYLVHKNCPLLRIRYIGTSFSIEFPEVKVNQDVKPYDIKLTISNFSAGTARVYDIYINGKQYPINISATDTTTELSNKICSKTYDGWTAEEVSNTSTGCVVLFKAEAQIDKYTEWRCANSSMSSTEISGCDFYMYSTFTVPFTWGFAPEVSTDEKGLVYGQDDFLNMDLNKQYSYASNIAVISERLWLVVNSSPCRIYVSRPYGTSQVIYPKESNDTILDFIQYQVVTTTSTVMKEESNLPVKILRDTEGNIQYLGTSQNQEMWVPSVEEIKTKADYDYALDLRRCAVTMGDLPDYEGGSSYRRISQVTYGSTFRIYWSIYYHITRDTSVDMSKIKYNSEDMEYYSDVYKKVVDENYVNIYVNDSGSGGLQFHYFKTQDWYVDTTKMYFSAMSSDSFVENPTTAGLEDYYEREIVFSQDYMSKVYEEKGEYLLESDGLPVDVTYDSVNGRVLKFHRSGDVYCEAIPYYNYDLSVDSDVYEETTQIDKVATSSTGMDLQFATGRNDHIMWIGQGSSVIVGTESSEHVLDYDINALDQRQSKYSDFGSDKGLVANVGRDFVYLQKGNKLRLMYKDYYGIQNVEVSLTSQKLLNGEILNMFGIGDPEPALVILKRVPYLLENTTYYKYSIVFISLDRDNGIQAFSEWTFSFDVLDICTQIINGVQRIVVLAVDDDKRFTAYFDFDEKTSYKDCGKDGTTVSDGTHNYVSLMRALPFDTQTQDGSITLGESKNVSKIVFRCLDTGRVVTWYNEKDRNTTRTAVCCDGSGHYIGGLADHAINVNGGTTRDLMIAVEAYEDEPMTLLAMAYELRVNRNGTGY